MLSSQPYILGGKYFRVTWRLLAVVGAEGYSHATICAIIRKPTPLELMRPNPRHAGAVGTSPTKLISTDFQVHRIGLRGCITERLVQFSVHTSLGVKRP